MQLERSMQKDESPGSSCENGQELNARAETLARAFHFPPGKSSVQESRWMDAHRRENVRRLRLR